MNHLHTLAVAAAAAGFAVPAWSQPGEVVLIEGFRGYAGVRDNTMFEEDGTLANGSGDHVFAGNTAIGDTRRALIRFDLVDLPLPPDAVITDVTLRLVTSRTRAAEGDRVIGVHRLLEDWGEGTEDAGGQEGGGTAATSGSATWTDNFFGSSTWTTPGGEFDPVTSAVETAGDVNVPTEWTGTGLREDVTRFIADESSNFGWILVGVEDVNQSSVRFYSADNDEGAGLDILPRLTIAYDSGPIDLEVSALVVGESATFTAGNVIPGAETFFLYSFAGAGSVFVPVLGIELDLALPITNFASAVADSAGVATVTGTVPANAPTTTISFQAVHLRDEDVARKSNRVDTEITN